MRLQLIRGLWALLLCAISTACAHSNQAAIQLPPEIINHYPQVPAEDLACADEPAVPADVTTDVALAKQLEAVRSAGADCRDKIHTLNGIVSSWPR